MNDEGASHYTAMLEQNGLGLQWLRATFGKCGRPHAAWQIDPFGHSKTQAELFALMGFDSVYFARIDYQDFNKRNKSKTLEMMWRGNDDYPDRDLFTGELYHHSYGPPPGFEWGHDFYDKRHMTDEPIIDNVQSDAYNLESRVADFMYQV